MKHADRATSGRPLTDRESLRLCKDLAALLGISQVVAVAISTSIGVEDGLAKVRVVRRRPNLSIGFRRAERAPDHAPRTSVELRICDFVITCHDPETDPIVSRLCPRSTGGRWVGANRELPIRGGVEGHSG